MGNFWGNLSREKRAEAKIMNLQVSFKINIFGHCLLELIKQQQKLADLHKIRFSTLNWIKH